MYDFKGLKINLNEIYGLFLGIHLFLIGRLDKITQFLCGSYIKFDNSN